MMNKNFKTYFMPFMVMFVIFMGVIDNSIRIITGSLKTTSLSHILVLLFAVVTIGIFIHDLYKGYIVRKDFRVLIFLFLIMGLFIVTPFFYGNNGKHMSYLLVYISETIPAAYIGMRASRTGSMEKLGDLLPIFVIPTSLLVGTIGLRYAAMGELVNEDDSEWNYQSLSYTMSFAYSYCAYYVFFHEQRNRGHLGKTLKIVMLLMMFYCALITLISGGRGAFVYLLFVTVLMALYYVRHSKEHKLRSFFVIGVIAIAVMWMINYFSVLSSLGMERVIMRLTKDDNREMLYKKAYEAFLESPIFGNGIGSVWWKVGFYSHNMFLDFLVETGIIGTFLISVLLIKILFKLYYYTRMNNLYIFLMILILSAMIRNTFSGYWVSAIRLFMICSWVYCLPKGDIKKIVGHIKNIKR